MTRVTKSWMRAPAGAAAAGAVACACALALLSGCEASEPQAYARRVDSPTQLVGGRGAIGTLGDWAIGNGNIRVIIQNQGWSRGFGVFGGGIIDADVVRPGAMSDGTNGTGKDNFGESFPTLFLEAFDVSDQEVAKEGGGTETLPGIEVIKDGSDGGEAILRTRASGGQFLTMIAEIVKMALPQRGLRFETDYIVRPGTRHVEIVGRLINESGTPLDMTGQTLGTLLAGFTGGTLQMPVGDVLLFGAGNAVFAPGGVSRLDRPGSPKPVGFDLRYSIEQSYKTLPQLGVHLPAIPGLVADFLATAGTDVSYGFASADSDNNLVWKNRDQYALDPEALVSKHALLVPFLMDAFTGAFSDAPPPAIAPKGNDGDVFEYRRYFIVGDGDVSSIREELFAIRGTATGTFEGSVVSEVGEPEGQARVHILDARGLPYSQAKVDAQGRFDCSLEPGRYSYRVTAPGRRPYPPVEELASTEFTVDVGTSAYAYVRIPQPAELLVSVWDEDGRAIPAKVTVVSHYDPAYDGLDPREFLFDFSLKESRLPTDISWRSPSSDKARAYIEEVLFARNGQALGPVRPNRCTDAGCETYDIYVSRGPEYDVVVHSGIKLTAGQRVELDAQLKHVVDTTDYVGADLHLHSANSIDSYSPVADQLTAAAAEGLDVTVATDHNTVTDYAPTIAALGLEDYLGSLVGVELTTLEMGHFNGFSLGYDTSVPTRFPFIGACNPANAEKANGSAFDWVECSPNQLFENLRALNAIGRDNTIIQVNHPRDTIMGYFNQYYLNPWTAVAEMPTPANYPESAFFVFPHNDETRQFDAAKFDLVFDSMEVLNGKRMDQLHGFVLPADAPAAVVEKKQDYRCGSGHPLNGPGQLVLKKGGYVAYPGAVDDWLHLLNTGREVTAVGNSDSHFTDDELGFPRTYVYVPPGANGGRRDNYPAVVTPLDLATSIKSHRAIVSNGPFLEMQVKTATADTGTPPCSSFTAEEACTNDGCTWDAQSGICVAPTRFWNMGDTVRYAQSNAGRLVDVLLTLRTTPWISVQRINIYANGKLIETLAVDQGTRPDGTAIDDNTTLVWSHTFDVDTVLVAEALGDGSMFPMVTPREDPPANIGEALQGLAGSFAANLSFGSGDGVSAPGYIQTVRPYALTNPIWLDINASGDFDPPGNDAGPGPAPAAACPEELVRRRGDRRPPTIEELAHAFAEARERAARSEAAAP